MLRILLFFAAITYCIFPASAQLGKSMDGGVLYEKEWSTGPMVLTPGFTLGWDLQFTRYIKADRYRLFDISLYQLKHPKEIALPNPNRQEPHSYVFGKKNGLTVIKGGFGMRHILADRLTQNGIRINFNYNLGPMLGIIKPVYYEIETIVDGQVKTVYEKFDPEDIQKQNNIIGTAPISKGLDEMGVMFGLGAKSSFSFEWGNYDYKFYSIETGVTVDAFPKDVPIFAFIDNNKLFVNLFLCFSFGNRN